MQLSGVRPSVRLSRYNSAGAALTQSGNRAAVAPGRSTALSSKCGQCRVYIQGTLMNTETCVSCGRSLTASSLTHGSDRPIG